MHRKQQLRASSFVPWLILTHTYFLIFLRVVKMLVNSYTSILKTEHDGKRYTPGTHSFYNCEMWTVFET